MSALGVHLTLLVGPTVAVPAPAPVVDALRAVEVRHSDQGRSGFQLVFDAGRSGPQDVVDSSLVLNPLLRPFNRVVLVVTFGVVPRVVSDGVITHHQLAPGSGQSGTTFTVTGEDVSVMMDLEERSAEHPAQDETIIANVLIAKYAQYGMIPMVLPPTVVDPPIPIERVPVQQATDFGYLQEMASRHGYVFYVSPGPAPLTNVAYWGPPKRFDVPQRALSVDMGSNTNVDRIDFENDALAPSLVAGSVQDRTTNQTMPVQTFASTRVGLASQPAWLVNQPNVRTVQLRESGLNAMQAFGRAQGITDASADVLKARGELDSVRYGDILRARSIVGLRGAGYSHDGFYYVKEVTHRIAEGDYRQSFTLTREGVGATSPVVVP